MSSFIRISDHAVQRYCERVNNSASRLEAAQAIRRIVDSATVRSKPRHWMGSQPVYPGRKYLYSAEQPNVCAVVVAEAVVTVFSRSVCAQWRSLEPNGRGRRGRATRRIRHWRDEARADRRCA